MFCDVTENAFSCFVEVQHNYWFSELGVADRGVFKVCAIEDFSIRGLGGDSSKLVLYENFLDRVECSGL